MAISLSKTFTRGSLGNGAIGPLVVWWDRIQLASIHSVNHRRADIVVQRRPASFINGAGELDHVHKALF